jgi:HAD superfamily hydrolase (TIGR01484 family)
MTRHDPIATTAIAAKDLVLATDLDGTFLGGSDADRARFYAWINANRARVGLIFVTGRDPGFIRQLLRAGGVPRPDYVVGDVGTTIATLDDRNHVSPIMELEMDIAEKWGLNGDKVQSALLGVKGLKLQSGAFRYRASYDMDPDHFEPRAVEIVEEMGLDALISDNRFFDVLPKGVSKGPSLERLVEHLGIDKSRVLVAGDTLNDRSMLTLGLPAVAVGNSEPGLTEIVRSMDHVHLATAHGVSGIAEAILAKGMFTARAA